MRDGSCCPSNSLPVGSLQELQATSLMVVVDSLRVLTGNLVHRDKIPVDSSHRLPTAHTRARRDIARVQACRSPSRNKDMALTSSSHPHPQALDVDTRTALECDSVHSIGRICKLESCPQSICANIRMTHLFCTAILASGHKPSASSSDHQLGS